MHDLKQYSTIKQAQREAGIGASNISGCYRKLAYEYLDTPVEEAPNTDAADLGTLLHLGWSAMIRSQYDPADRDVDVTLRLEELPRSVSADDVDYRNLVCRDLKSAKDRVWQKWVNDGGPYPHFWEQLSIYTLALYREQPGAWQMCVTAINRETGEVVEFWRDFDVEVAVSLAETARDRHRQLSAAAAVVASGADSGLVVEAFPREGKGPGRGMPCDFCEFVQQCWPKPSSDDGSPQSETIRGSDREIGAFAAEYLQAADEARKADARKRDAQAFIRGLDGEYEGPDGEVYRISTSGGGGGDAPDCGAMKARLEELGEPVPMKWVARASYPRVSRVKR